MTEYKQPWRRVDVGRRRVRLQILDPETAFDFEGALVDALGDTLSLLIAAPDQVTGAVIQQATGVKGIEAALRDPVRGPDAAGSVVLSTAHVISTAMCEAVIDHRTVGRMFRKMVLGKLRIGDEDIIDLRDYRRARFGPWDKWRLLGKQIEQSYGPLWTRRPYRLRAHREDYGVPRPPDVPQAVAWADRLAKSGAASSMHEMLTTWTPERMVQAVELAAQEAETVRRMQAAAKKQGG